MALSNIASWTQSKKTSACGSACGSGDKPEAKASACGTSDKVSACGSACGASDDK